MRLLPPSTGAVVHQAHDHNFFKDGASLRAIFKSGLHSLFGTNYQAYDLQLDKYSGWRASSFGYTLGVTSTSLKFHRKKISSNCSVGFTANHLKKSFSHVGMLCKPC